MKRKVILDCDNTMGLRHKEVDDGLVILYLLGCPDIELLGVTTTFGNGPLAQVYPQTVAFLRGIGRPDIPVLRGEAQRGEAPTEAAVFLRDMAARYPGEIDLLAIGPLGNVRAAQELDAGFLGNLRQVACMGGYLGPLRLGYRDVHELNLSADPEASYLLFNGPCPVALFNAQTCLQARFGWSDLRRLRGWSRGMRAAVRNWLAIVTIFTGWPWFYLWDLLPAVYLTHPDLFERRDVAVVSTVEELASGHLALGEGSTALNMPPRITDLTRFHAVLDAAWHQAPASSFDPRVRPTRK